MELHTPVEQARNDAETVFFSPGKQCQITEQDQLKCYLIQELSSVT